jgi:hypothetical protein
VAPELPGVTEENVGAVYTSRMDPSWASVRISPEGEREDFVVFSHKEGDLWRAEKSIRADEPDYPDNDVVPLAGVPKDLLDYVYEENLFAAEVPEPKVEEVDGLPDVGPAEAPPLEAVVEDVPEGERERIEEVVESSRSGSKATTGWRASTCGTWRGATATGFGPTRRSSRPRSSRSPSWSPSTARSSRAT